VPVAPELLGGRSLSLGEAVPGEAVSRAPPVDEQPTSETDTAVAVAAPTISAL
jgi:hypothetical protein